MIELLSFGFFLLLFTGIGIASSWFKTDSTEDYLVAGRSVNPWLTALSSVATNNSGFMFIGLIGFTFRDGLHTIWMAVAWVLGDLLVWMFVHRRVRQRSGDLDVESVPSLLGRDADGVVQRPIVIAAGILTFVLLGGYAAAQLNAGSTALNALFGWDLRIGAVLGAVIVVVYCFSGGLRASIWTDAAQAVVMLISIGLLLATSMWKVGAPPTLLDELRAIDPSLVKLFPTDLALGFGLYFAGFVAGGLGAIGQPHILIRSMAIEDARAIPRARRIYFAWFIPFYAAAVLLALYARVQLPELMVAPEGLTGTAAEEAVVAATEGALPILSVALLPDVLVGLMLAGLFSATMSTADSQILACSAAVTQDVAPRWNTSTRASKVATLSVTLLALGIALSASEGVFALVLGAWSLLGASLGPILLARLTRLPLPTPLALAMMGSGLLTVVVWGYTPWSGDVFKLLPGLAVPLSIWAGWQLSGGRPRQAPGPEPHRATRRS